jgi:hypothetical protein
MNRLIGTSIENTKIVEKTQIHLNRFLVIVNRTIINHGLVRKVKICSLKEAGQTRAIAEPK